MTTCQTLYLLLEWCKTKNLEWYHITMRNTAAMAFGTGNNAYVINWCSAKV